MGFLEVMIINTKRMPLNKDNMASSEDQDQELVTNLTAITEFKAGMVRSLKQYKAGEVETFDSLEDLLRDLHED